MVSLIPGSAGLIQGPGAQPPQQSPMNVEALVRMVMAVKEYKREEQASETAQAMQRVQLAYTLASKGTDITQDPDIMKALTKDIKTILKPTGIGLTGDQKAPKVLESQQQTQQPQPSAEGAALDPKMVASAAGAGTLQGGAQAGSQPTYKGAPAGGGVTPKEDIASSFAENLRLQAQTVRAAGVQEAEVQKFNRAILDPSTDPKARIDMMARVGAATGHPFTAQQLADTATPPDLILRYAARGMTVEQSNIQKQYYGNVLAQSDEYKGQGEKAIQAGIWMVDNPDKPLPENLRGERSTESIQKEIETYNEVGKVVGYENARAIPGVIEAMRHGVPFDKALPGGTTSEYAKAAKREEERLGLERRRVAAEEGSLDVARKALAETRLYHLEEQQRAVMEISAQERVATMRAMKEMMQENREAYHEYITSLQAKVKPNEAVAKAFEDGVAAKLGLTRSEAKRYILGVIPWGMEPTYAPKEGMDVIDKETTPSKVTSEKPSEGFKMNFGSAKDMLSKYWNSDFGPNQLRGYVQAIADAMRK